jgi:hypothetical protein
MFPPVRQRRTTSDELFTPSIRLQECSRLSARRVKKGISALSWLRSAMRTRFAQTGYSTWSATPTGARSGPVPRIFFCFAARTPTHQDVPGRQTCNCSEVAVLRSHGTNDPARRAATMRWTTSSGRGRRGSRSSPGSEFFSLAEPAVAGFQPARRVFRRIRHHPGSGGITCGLEHSECGAPSSPG